MIDGIKKVLGVLLMIDESPGSLHRWRLLVALFIMAFCVHIMWACGYGKSFGLLGFAEAADLTDIKSQLNKAADAAGDVQMKLLKKSIIDTRILQCNADSKRFFTQRLQELLDEYYNSTKRVFDLPTCTDLK